MMQLHLTLPQIVAPLAHTAICEALHVRGPGLLCECIQLLHCLSQCHSHFWPDLGFCVPLLKLQRTGGVFFLFFNRLAEHCSCRRVGDIGRQNKMIKYSVYKSPEKPILFTFPTHIFTEMLVLRLASSKRNCNYSTRRLLTESRHQWLSELPAAISHRLIINDQR